MASNPLTQFGSLNRVIQSVNWANFTNLNITAEDLGRGGIRLALEGKATDYLPVNTGAVTSPQVYQMCTLTIAIVKTLNLVAAYKAQYEADTRLGNATARTDSTALPPYDLSNMSMTGIGEMTFNGEDPAWVVVCEGYYLVNSDIFN